MRREDDASARFGGLWRQPEFLKLWAALTVSAFDSPITALALPLTAVLLLGASPGEMGLLTAAQTAPYLVVGLLAGVLVDRWRPRPVLAVAIMGYGLLLSLIPGAAAAGWLRIEILYAVVALIGLLSVFGDVAFSAVLPAVVGREHFVEGNSRLEASRSAAQIAGPSLAGALIGVLTPIAALALAAVADIGAGLLLTRIRELAPAGPKPARRGLGNELGDGLRLTLGDPILRTITGALGLWNLAAGMQATVFILYATRELGLTPFLIGLVMTGGGVGWMVGALVARRVVERLGPGRASVGALLVASVGSLLILVARGSPAVVLALLIGAQFLTSLGLTIFHINRRSLQLAVTPDHLRGRVIAVILFVAGGIVPVGGLLAGALGETIGLLATLGVAGAVRLLAALFVWRSPIRGLRQMPEPAPATAPAGA
jgi:MFS family permease